MRRTFSVACDQKGELPMTPPETPRRSFLKGVTAFAGTSVLAVDRLAGKGGAAPGLLVAYVGTFSSPLGDVPDTQVIYLPGTARASTSFTWTARAAT